MAGQVDDLLRSGLNYVYGSHWDEFSEAFGARVIVEGVGILITYNDEVIKIAAGVFSGLRLDNGLVQCVADICIGTRIGGFYLSREGDGDTWCLIYAIKLPKIWLDPSSKASAQMLADSRMLPRLSTAAHNIYPIIPELLISDGRRAPICGGSLCWTTSNC